MASIWPHLAHLKNLLSSLPNSYILEVWQMNCRNSIFRLTNSHFPLPEDKSGLFVLILPSRPLFSGLLRTKVPILSFFGQLLLGFGPFRGQNRGFCPRLVFPTSIARLSERKSWVFARVWSSRGHFSGLSSAKVAVLRAFASRKRHFSASRAQNSTFCALGAPERHKKSAQSQIFARSICFTCSVL